MVYCLIPAELAPRLEAGLRRGLTDEFEVVIDRRRAERRRGEARRLAELEATGHESFPPAPRILERRRVRNYDGLRISERRATLVPVSPPTDLPRRARTEAHRLLFVERLELGREYDEEIATARLITRIQAGDRDARAGLYGVYFDRVYSYLRLMSGAHEVEDLLELGFLSAFGQLGDYQFNGPFRAWLFAVLQDRLAERLPQPTPWDAGARPAVRFPAAIQRTDTVHEALLGLGDHDLLVLLRCLPLAERQVVALRFLVGLHAAEVGEVIGVSAEAVRETQHRALSLLRGRLEALGHRAQPVARTAPIPMRRASRQAPVLRARRLALTF